MRGGFTVHVTFVRENRAYSHITQGRCAVDEQDSSSLKWEHFVSKLQPGQKETWIRPSIYRPQGGRRRWPRWWPRCTTQSLDAYLPHNWPQLQRLPRGLLDRAVAVREQRACSFSRHPGQLARDLRRTWTITYRSFPAEIIDSARAYGMYARPIE